MPIDRRGFLSLLAGSFVGLPLRARPEESGEALAERIHRDTRNTRLGAIGRSLWPSAGPRAIAKAYAGHARVPLPEAIGGGSVRLHDAAREPAAALLSPEPVDLATLAGLLHLTNGVTRRGSPPLRAAPSAGALYAGEVYVLASGVESLAAGVYSYHVPSHSLVRVADGDPRERLLAAVEQTDAMAGAPLTILLTNVFRRYGWRYANRGYRYALIDSGHIGENLRLAARALGMGTCSPTRFHDARLNALIGVDQSQEAVCAMHAVGRPGEATASRGPGAGLIEAQRAPGFRADPEAGMTERYHAATALVPGDARSRPVPRPKPAAPTTSARHVLPTRAAPPASVSWAICERRSAARFDAAPVAGADLGYLLELARGDPTGSREIDLRLAVHRVRGLPPGLYRYDPTGSALLLLRSGDLRTSLRRACGGQEPASAAAAGVAMVADLSLAGVRGDRAYRDLLLEAGAIAQRLYLGAEALGLTARNLAAFFDDTLNDLLALDGEREVIVHLTMLGNGN